jgi:hypothetical protein
MMQAKSGQGGCTGVRIVSGIYINEKNIYETCL